MLPGFRFLFAAILLSASILVFGLGAAALLRATHEQYVSNSSWRNGPQEKVFAQAAEPSMPVLATLRAEPEIAAAPTMRDQVPTIALPVTDADPAAIAIDTQPEVVARIAEAPAADLAKPDLRSDLRPDLKPEPIVLAPTEVTAPDTLTPADTTVVIPADRSVATRTTLAAASPVFDLKAARVAALNELTPAASSARTKETADGGTDAKAAKPRANRVKKRRRIVRRPPPPQVQQQALDPFGQQQQQPAFATTATRTR